MFFVNYFGFRFFINEKYNEKLPGNNLSVKKSKWDVDMLQERKKNKLAFFLEQYQPEHLKKKKKNNLCRIEIVEKVFERERRIKTFTFEKKTLLFIDRFFDKFNQEPFLELQEELKDIYMNFFKLKLKERMVGDLVPVYYNIGPKIKGLGMYGIYNNKDKIVFSSDDLFEVVKKFYIPEEGMVVKRHFI